MQRPRADSDCEIMSDRPAGAGSARECDAGFTDFNLTVPAGQIILTESRSLWPPRGRRWPAARGAGGDFTPDTVAALPG